MLRVLLLFSCVLATMLAAQAQQVTDTVSTGPGYANQVYYSLRNDEVKTVVRDEWDIAFRVTSSGSAVLSNGGVGTEVYMYPNGDTSSWSNLDTTGITMWGKYYNSDTTWTVGAFNRTKSGLDLGWGNYSTITHYVTADSLFVVKLSNGAYKKLWIERLASKVWYFKFADLDGSNQVVKTVQKLDYDDRYFIYYSIQNDAILDREPADTTWDLLFTKYVRSEPSVYGVTGVLTNETASTAQVTGMPSDQAVPWGLDFMDNISVMGWDWKTYVHGTGYLIEDSLAYFISTHDMEIWKLVFTGFGGSADGNFIFTKELMGTTGLKDENGSVISNMVLYPNPSFSGQTTVLFTTQKAADAVIELVDLSGRIMHSDVVRGMPGLNRKVIPTNALPAGLYVARVTVAGSSAHQKLMVR